MSEPFISVNNLAVTRRVRRVSISPILFVEMCKEEWAIPNSLQIRIENSGGVPKDAVYLRGGYDSLRDVFVLVFEHPSFDEIKDNDSIPEFSISLRRIYLSEGL